jgi:hypothetical protein
VGDGIVMAGCIASGNAAGAVAVGTAMVQNGVDLAENAMDDTAKPNTGPSGSSAGGAAGSGDAAYWTDYLKTHGYAEFRKQFEAGNVPNDVFKDPGFTFALQNATQDESRMWQMLTTMSANDHQMQQSIMQNMRLRG